VTAARVVATPFMVLLIVRAPAAWWTVAAWFILSCTDGLDGFLARRQGTTRSGAFLDPLADKVCVLAAMVTLVAIGVWWWPPVALIAAREVIQIVWRIRLGRRGVSVPAGRGAKLKTLLQDLAVGFALLPAAAALPAVAVTTLWLAAGLTLFTGARYLLARPAF
jgi:CDP-diacylglycerol--glycerol-3-phosphate 3-phosphatidyltransferase